MVFRVDENGLMYQISIPQEDEDRFLKAQEGGKLKYIKVNYDELPEYSGNLRFSKLFYKKKRKITIDEERTLKRWEEDKYKEIENLIYSKYPQSKQNSDLADKLYYENLLKAKGIENLESDIVKRVEEYYKGKNLDEVISNVADENKEAYLQLIKVGIRVTWVQMCKNELKKAIEEQREPEFPKYPL